jgi:hypothetical protein
MGSCKYLGFFIKKIDARHQADGVMWLDPHGFLKYFDVITLSAISVMLPRSLPL